MKKSPSQFDLLVAILHFLSADGPDQNKVLRDYLDLCERDPSRRAHVGNPVAEIAGGVERVFDREDSAYSKEACEIVDAIAWFIDLITCRPNGCVITDDQILNNPEWRIIRLLSKEALTLIRPESTLN